MNGDEDRPLTTQSDKMATNKYQELQKFSDEELQAEITETEAQYVKMRFDHHVTGLENPMRIREVRRDIARMKSELRRRELENATPEQLAGRSRIRARRSKGK